ncbi:DUF6528 family protein [Streptomyces sp. DH12]|uniref:DUF6528 family protein n=1 Tax=Streptomyces sp. DH12 TaxID=2857010 RepID=UPI001E56ABF0|nr:DUF6528 family protein [Streptomyces sp. DH12]
MIAVTLAALLALAAPSTPATGPAPAAPGPAPAAPGPAPAVPAPSDGTVPPGTPDVIVTEQGSRRLVVFDGRRRVWGPAAERWAFTPLGDPRYADLAPERSWVHPDEAKVRRWRGRTYVLTTASYGFAAVVAYPSGDRYWARALAPGTLRVNPHSAELLPDGSVAVAGSTGDLVRLYEPPPGERYAEFALDDAHGLVWDGRLGVLWALGGDRLVALRPHGAGGRPALREVYGVRLPEPGGHDLGQVARDPDRLWVSTGRAVHQYVKSRRAFVRDYPGAAAVSRARVKAVGDDPLTRQVLSTVPEPGLAEDWWTTGATVHRPGPAGAGAYRLPGGGIYKARWWRLPSGATP